MHACSYSRFDDTLSTASTVSPLDCVRAGLDTAAVLSVGFAHELVHLPVEVRGRPAAVVDPPSQSRQVRWAPTSAHRPGAGPRDVGPDRVRREDHGAGTDKNVTVTSCRTRAIASPAAQRTQPETGTRRGPAVPPARRQRRWWLQYRVLRSGAAPHAGRERSIRGPDDGLRQTAVAGVQRRGYALAVERALRLGGRHIDVGQGPDADFVVLADSGGNELCVIEPGNKYLAGTGYLGEVTCDGTRDVGLFWRDARARRWCGMRTSRPRSSRHSAEPRSHGTHGADRRSNPGMEEPAAL
jgi:hypothetical protein